MDKYENLGIVGEGSYGMVLKCKHKDTNQIVAIKKFLENEDDKIVKKIALREIKMLKMLRHDHLVNLIEVFRRRKRLYLVFEFMDHTILNELEKFPHGLDEIFVRKILWQVLRGLEFCHLHNIIHRDIKPENILISKTGIVKVCDFGFARTITPGPREVQYTDYVATRWYRAPELLVGDTKYGKAVDTWAVGCLVGEMLCGEPLFPGDSDIDQLYYIIKCFGNLIPHHKEIFSKNPMFSGAKLPEVQKSQTLQKRFPKSSEDAKNFMEECLRLDPDLRPTCSQLLKKELMQRDSFYAKFSQEIRAKIQRENQNGPLQKIQKSMDIIKNEEKRKKQKEREQKEKDNHSKGKRKPVDTEKWSIFPQMDHQPAIENVRACSQVQDAIVSSDFLSATLDVMPPINYAPMSQRNLQSRSDEKCLKQSPLDKIKQFSKFSDTFRKGQEKHLNSESKKSKSKETDRKDSLILPKMESSIENGKTWEKATEKGSIGSTPHIIPFDPSKYQDLTKSINLPSVI